MTRTEQGNIKHTPDSTAISMAVSDQVNITQIAITLANIQGQITQIDKRFEAQTRNLTWIIILLIAAITSMAGRAFGLY